MRILDRYIVREVVTPFLIALLVFTFILIVPFILDLAEQLIAKGVPWPTLLKLMATLLPQALGLTIPMSLLIGILVAFGRLASDRELVVLMACGVSPYRLLRPVFALAILGWASTLWVLLSAIPSANQAFREMTVRIVQDRAESQVRPRVFFEDFPNVVLYVASVAPGGGWKDVLAADTRNPATPVIYLARGGRMLVDRGARTIQLLLEDGTRHVTRADDPTAYEVARFKSTLMQLDPGTVFPQKGPAPGDREMTIAQLRGRIAALEAEGVSTHNQVMEIHKKFSIPTACFVFALLGVALGISNRRDGKLASFVLGVGVIFVYYVVMFTAQSMTKGHMVPAWLAMWVPNLLLGGAGAVLLFSRVRRGERPLRIVLPRPSFGRLWKRRPAESVRRAVAGAQATPSLQTGPVLVIRIPQFDVPRPRLLDLYVARLYVRVLLLAAVGMAGLFYISTFIDLSDKWFKGDATLAMLLGYLWWGTPQFAYYILAIAVLLSALVTIGLLTKSSELIVMRACGVSVYRASVPLLLFAVAASAVLLALQERVLAPANRQAEQLRHVIRGLSPQTFDVLNRKWLMGGDGRVYHYQFYDPRRSELNGLSVFEFDPASHRMVRRLFAGRAAYDPRASAEGEQELWRVERGWVREFSADVTVTRFTALDNTSVELEGADYFVTEAPEPDRMNFAQLRRYVDELRRSGYDVLGYEVSLQRKIAFPFVTIVMTLIAIPFGVTTGRRGATYGIGIGIVLALVYWTAISVFAAVGTAGLLHPALAAWAPNILFGTVALYLLLTVRT